MCNLKPIEYFLEEEHQYIEMRKDNQDLCFLPDFGIVPSNIDDPLSFLEQNLFHKVYPTIHDLREKLNTSGLKFTDAELLMLLSFEGFMSQYFRNDYWGKHEPPIIVQEMQSCLYSLIAKSPTFTGTILYRFCVSEDKIDFKIGQDYTCPHSLTTTCDNWDKDTNRYIITPLPKSQTKAHSIFKIYNHGEENQVNFLPNTSFVITDIVEIPKRECIYKHIYMNEM